MKTPSILTSCLLALLLATAPLAAQPVDTAPDAPPAGPRLALHTSLGTIIVQLDVDRAPLTAQNFLEYADEGFYNGTIFHRVIDNMLIQGGAFTPDLNLKPTRAAVPSEAEFTRSNLRGTVAAARSPSDPDSHTSQFFINVVDNPRLDWRGEDETQRGYAVFAVVVDGMDVVDRIRAVETGERAPLPRGVPLTPVLIERVERLDPPEPAADTGED